MKNTTPQKTRRRVTLTEKVTISLRNDIQNGSLMPGMMLPTEPVLSQKFGVSRTVIREAVAALKAEGLLAPRQGAGVFVLTPAESNSSIFESGNSQISDVLEILELRMAVEIEAASLACARCSMAHQAKLFEALQEMIVQVEKGGSGVKADYEFHRAIAGATNNRKYSEFLEYLGEKTIPRARLKLRPIEEEGQTTYMAQILEEHHRIYEAIAARDARKARQAMRDHLSRSQVRYQNFLNE